MKTLTGKGVEFRRGTAGGGLNPLWAKKTLHYTLMLITYIFMVLHWELS